MEMNFRDVQSLIDSKSPILVICVADWCKHCQELKTKLPELKELANSKGINLEAIKATEPENEAFLTRNPFETLPYCLVFVDGEFKGGENASEEMLSQLIPAISECVKRDALRSPEYKELA